MVGFYTETVRYDPSVEQGRIFRSQEVPVGNIEFQYHFMVYTTKVPSDGNTAFFGVLADVGNCAELARYRPVPANFDVNGHLVVAK